MIVGSELHAWRAALLWFPDPAVAELRYCSDGLLVTGRDTHGLVRVVASGEYAQLAPQFAHLPLTWWPGLCIAPGFVDLHVHYPQTDVSMRAKWPVSFFRNCCAMV